MSTSSKAIFTKRLYFTEMEGRQCMGYTHYKNGDTPVFTDTGEWTQQIITSLIRGMATSSMKQAKSKRLGPIARLEIIWKTSAHSGLLAYDENGKLLFHAVTAWLSDGINGNLVRLILELCHVPEKIISGIFEKTRCSFDDSYAIVVSREVLTATGKPAGSIDDSWQLGFANEALQKV